MISIATFAREDIIKGDEFDIEMYNGLKPGIKRLRIDYYFSNPYDGVDPLGTIDVFESGQIGCLAVLQSGAETIYADYVKIVCDKNPKPISMLKNGYYLIDNEKDKTRIERAKALLEEYGTPIRSGEEMERQIEASYKINIPSFHI